MTPEQLRQLADETEAREYWLDDHVRLAMQFRAHADLLERYAKLKAHAEAMAEALWCEHVQDPTSAYNAYRADFPEGK